MSSIVWLFPSVALGLWCLTLQTELRKVKSEVSSLRASTSTDTDLDASVRRLLSAGSYLEAIDLYRKEQDVPLAEAKSVVDRIRNE